MVEGLFEEIAKGQGKQSGVEENYGEDVGSGKPENGSEEVEVIRSGVEAAKGEFGADEGEFALGNSQDFKHIPGEVRVVGVGVVEVVGVEEEGGENGNETE
jgi:hypothetical protein